MLWRAVGAQPSDGLIREDQIERFRGFLLMALESIAGNPQKLHHPAMRKALRQAVHRSVVDTLVGKTLNAARSERISSIVVAGGVGANVMLRAELARGFEGKVFYPRPEFCTDNGAMIAVAGAFRISDAVPPGEIEARARWPLYSLKPPKRNRK